MAIFTLWLASILVTALVVGFIVHHLVGRQPVTATIHPLQTETANGASSLWNVEGYVEALITLNVTAASGTNPMLDVYIDVTDDGGTTWYSHVNVAHGIVGPSQQTLTLGRGGVGGGFGHAIRARWSISGTDPSFTFSIKASPKQG